MSTIFNPRARFRRKNLFLLVPTLSPALSAEVEAVWETERGGANSFGWLTVKRFQRLLLRSEQLRGRWKPMIPSVPLLRLGTIEASLDWVYGERLANRSPDLDYAWLESSQE